MCNLVLVLSLMTKEKLVFFIFCCLSVKYGSLSHDFHQEMVFLRNVSGFLTLSSIFNLDFSHGSSLHLDLTAEANPVCDGLGPCGPKLLFSSTTH